MVDRPPRTVLEHEIRKRGLTPYGFGEAAERFAQEHGMDATLSRRHAQRLVAGHGPRGEPLGPLRRSTRRLLEAMFGRPAEELLRPLAAQTSHPERGTSLSVDELRARLELSYRIDRSTIELFQQKIELTRVLDRQLGGLSLLGELRELVRQLEEVIRHALRLDVRTALATVLVDCASLAGWQSLDRGDIREAWHHYEVAKQAALEARSRDLEAYAHAEQAVVLLDIGATKHAAQLTEYALSLAGPATPPILMSWLAAAHGEARAAQGDRDGCLYAFDRAAEVIPPDPDPADAPYIVFGPVHLTRWRGSALARLGDTESVVVLSDALNRLDPSFVRAEAALRVDLAQTLAARGERDEASSYAHQAQQIALTIGSVRQRNRLAALPL